MPPLNQQSSRTGLFATLVILIVLLVGTLIWAFYATTHDTESQRELTSLKQKYTEVITDNGLVSSDSELNNLRQFKTEYNVPGSIVDAAGEERRLLTKIIKGTDDTNVKAVLDSAKGTLAQAAAQMKDAGLTAVPTDSLEAAITTLAGTVDAEKKLADQAEKSRDDMAAAAAAAAASQATALKERDAKVAEQTARADEAEKKLQAANAAIADKYAQITTDQQKAVTDYTTSEQKKDAQVTQLKNALAQKTAEYNKAVQIVAKYRPDVIDVMIRRSGVHILRVQNTDTVYVDVGSGERVNPGLTFEVYDKAEGIPKLGDGLSDDGLPAGKASIEVVRVGLNSSEARVVHLAPGAVISEGDICANIAYDRSVTPNFMVYGNFDMDFNGVYTAQEAEVVKSLVKRFGGNVVDKISISTDFLVLGQEPDVPVLTPDEANDPPMVAKVDAAKAALKAYNEVREQAATLHIPVMNQNRFLYYVGYFDSAKR